MIRQILAGNKTQTRRVVKPQPHIAPLVYSLPGPYGQPGDHLWVREACLIDGWYDGGEKELPLHTVHDEHGDEHTILYQADYPQLRAIDDDGGQKYRKDGSEASVRWRSPHLMPRWASRITLEMTDVRVERLQDISEEDARAEGIEPVTIPSSLTVGTVATVCTAAENFAFLWDDINGKKHPWASNPWVWVVSFRRAA